MENIMNQDTIEQKPFYSVTLLNETGDITLTWDDGEDAEIKKMIQSKLDAGYVFFILEPRVSFLKMLGQKKRTIKDISEIKGNKIVMKTDDSVNASSFLGNVSLGDSDAEKLFLAGRVGIANVRENDYNTVKSAKTVAEVMRNHTIATPRITAG
jgi:hypothetical protein